MSFVEESQRMRPSSTVHQCSGVENKVSDAVPSHIGCNSESAAYVVSFGQSDPDSNSVNWTLESGEEYREEESNPSISKYRESLLSRCADRMVVGKSIPSVMVSCSLKSKLNK